MIKTTTVFLDFTAETAAQASITAYANDFGSRAVLVDSSVTLKSDEHLIVSYYSGDEVIFTQEISGNVFLLPNVVIGTSGKYEAYFAVYNGSGVKLTATAAVEITVLENRVMDDIDTDLEVQSIYSQLIGEYDRLLLSVEKIKASLSGIADITVGKNLFDKSLATEQLLDYETGAVCMSSSTFLSAFIAVSKGMSFLSTYTLDGVRWNAPCIYAAYDKNFNYLQNLTKKAVYSFAVMNDTIAYIRVCVSTEYSNQFQVERTDISHSVSGYEEYSQSTALKSSVVQSDNLAPSSVRYYHLTDGAVTESKLSDSAVTSNKIAAQSVLPTHISNSLAELLDFDITEELSGKIMKSTATRRQADSMFYAFYGLSTQESSPSPSSAKEITDTYSAQIRVSGKNILENTWQTLTDKGISFTVTSKGGIALSGTSTAEEGTASVFPLISAPLILPEGTYAFSGISEGGEFTYYYEIITQEGDSLIITEPTVKTFDSTVTVNSFNLCVCSEATVDMTVYPQLEHGGKVTAYSSPNTIQSVSYDGTLCGIEVTQSDDYTVKWGDRYFYCDSIDKNRTVHRIRSLTLDGTSEGAKVTAVNTDSTGRTVALITLASKAKKFLFSTGIICSHFKASMGDGYGICYISDDGKSLCLVHEDSSVKTVDAWNSWLSQHSVQVRYALAAYTSSPAVVQTELSTIYPTMTVLCPDGIGYLSFKSDIKRYVDSVIVDVLGGSY